MLVPLGDCDHEAEVGLDEGAPGGETVLDRCLQGIQVGDLDVAGVELEFGLAPGVYRNRQADLVFGCE